MTSKWMLDDADLPALHDSEQTDGAATVTDPRVNGGAVVRVEPNGVTTLVDIDAGERDLSIRVRRTVNKIA